VHQNAVENREKEGRERETKVEMLLEKRISYKNDHLLVTECVAVCCLLYAFAHLL
jgi:hypothetical protein